MQIIKRNYHWVIAAITLLVLAIHVGILNNIVSLYIIPVTTELEISRGSFSLAYSTRNLVSFLSTLFSGFFFIKFGHRKLAAIALLIAAGAYALLGSSQNVFMLGLACVIMGLIEAFCSTSAASRVVNTWFHTHQGLVLGLVTAATGFGGSLFSIILSRSIAANGWRSSYYLCAVLVAATAVLTYLLSRDRPESIGLLPYGSGKHHGKKARKESRDHWHGYEPKEVLKKPTFYLMIAVVFLSSTCVYSAYSVIVSHLQDCGISAQDAASIQSILLLTLAASKFVCGLLSDFLGAKTVNVLCMVCSIAGLFLLACINGYPTTIAAVLFFSIGLVIVTVPIPLLSSALFGYHPQPTLIGIFMALPSAASAIIQTVVNTVYDHIGSYRPVFLTAAGIGVVNLGLMVLLFVLADRDRAKYESAHPELKALSEAQ